MTRYETWDAINQGDPYGRIAIARQLAERPPSNWYSCITASAYFQEWVYNAADIDGSGIVGLAIWDNRERKASRVLSGSRRVAARAGIFIRHG